MTKRCYFLPGMLIMIQSYFFSPIKKGVIMSVKLERKKKRKTGNELDYALTVVLEPK